MNTSRWSVVPVALAAALVAIGSPPGQARTITDSPDYSQVVLSDSPALYWRLGETTGDSAVDASGNGRNGNYRGKPHLGADGLIVGDPDTSVAFDGVDDHVGWKPHRTSYAGPFTARHG